VLAYLCHAGYPIYLAAQRLSRVKPTQPDAAFLRQLADHLGVTLDAAQIEELSSTLWSPA
jgi:hypothetical protein